MLFGEKKCFVLLNGDRGNSRVIETISCCHVRLRRICHIEHRKLYSVSNESPLHIFSHFIANSDDGCFIIYMKVAGVSCDLHFSKYSRIQVIRIKLNDEEWVYLAESHQVESVSNISR